MEPQYLIYKNISASEFTLLKGDIKEIENYMTTYLKGFQFNISDHSSMSDILGLDYLNSNHFMGNIGFLFDDLPNKSTFSFYVTKSFDRGKLRHFKKIRFAEQVDIKYIQKNIVQLLPDAVAQYLELTESDLTDVIELSNDY